MENNTNSSAKVTLIGDSLNKARTVIQDLLTFSLEEIKNNPSSEEEILNLWLSSIRNVEEFFFKEFERTNNKKIYKRMIRLLMFKR
ncbi:hypothetical protein I6U48_21555 [Clostridium sp. PL3]|uniref:Uncharacterized protein n=1 Tax=Clostridium thailandense TaxID=2794346 RepID=A0A949X5E1_9CLOT|nr:hypothetical protein [Clostridium thailandense]MBV7275493.1 hypothetical protein [Clostridium thailandense]